MITVEDIAEDEIIFYDIETTSVFAPYCKLKLLAYQLGVNGEPELVDLNDKESREKFTRLIGSEIFKVSYNGINFDDVVLWQHGMWVNPVNRHDMYLALKTVHPTFPSYSLKFVNYMLDMQQSDKAAVHWPECKLERELVHGELDKKDMYVMQRLKPGLLEEYCMHDVRETRNVFRAIWELVQKPLHWEPYTLLELAMGEPLHEMMLLGREHINLKQIEEEIVKNEELIDLMNKEARVRTKGKITNLLSNKQVTEFLSDEFGYNFVKSEAGNNQFRKTDKLQFLGDENLPRFEVTLRHSDWKRGHSKGAVNAEAYEALEKNAKLSVTPKLDKWIINASYEVFDLTKVVGYFRSFLRAGRFERRNDVANRSRINSEFYLVDSASKLAQRGSTFERDGKERDNSEVSIPKSYYLSGARTRRFQSSSRFGINFQNQNKRSKVIQLVPRGWIGFWLDSTQIENITHIWASKDIQRREAYEADINWNEYVWLCNEILGGERTREKLDEIKSKVNPAWSVYKQFKTIKLALNFGMGPEKFAATTGLKKQEATELFELVHKACPAIRNLQKIVRKTIAEEGFIPDPFGHIYSGKLEQAYKIVAYLIQGCGTGSIPKAMTIANFNSIHAMDRPKPIYKPYVYHPYKKMYSFAVLTGTTHDECAGRISLGLPTYRIIQLFRELLFNMEERFSPLFKGIPLRAKLSISIDNAAKTEEINHHASNFESRLTAMIEKGKHETSVVIH